MTQPTLSPSPVRSGRARHTWYLGLVALSVAGLLWAGWSWWIATLDSIGENLTEVLTVMEHTKVAVPELTATVLGGFGAAVLLTALGVALQLLLSW